MSRHGDSISYFPPFFALVNLRVVLDKFSSTILHRHGDVNAAWEQVRARGTNGNIFKTCCPIFLVTNRNQMASVPVFFSHRLIYFFHHYNGRLSGNTFRPRSVLHGDFCQGSAIVDAVGEMHKESIEFSRKLLPHVRRPGRIIVRQFENENLFGRLFSAEAGRQVEKRPKSGPGAVGGKVGRFQGWTSRSVLAGEVRGNALERTSRRFLDAGPPASSH